MAETERKRRVPESHLIEELRTIARARSWQGCVRISTGAGAVQVPGRWHLELPGELRRSSATGRDAVALPVTDDADGWHDYLRDLVSLRMPGARLRVRGGVDVRGQLEFTAPTAPPSVVRIDRCGIERVLGPAASITLLVDAAG